MVNSGAYKHLDGTVIATRIDGGNVYHFLIVMSSLDMINIGMRMNDRDAVLASEMLLASKETLSHGGADQYGMFAKTVLRIHDDTGGNRDSFVASVNKLLQGRSRAMYETLRRHGSVVINSAGGFCFLTDDMQFSSIRSCTMQEASYFISHREPPKAHAASETVILENSSSCADGVASLSGHLSSKNPLVLTDLRSHVEYRGGPSGFVQHLVDEIQAREIAFKTTGKDLGQVRALAKALGTHLEKSNRHVRLVVDTNDQETLGILGVIPNTTLVLAAN